MFVIDGRYGDWNRRYAKSRADFLYRNGYRRVRLKISGKDEIFGAHRVIWKMATGRDPVEHIDHIDRDPGNNALSNLRDVTHLQNMQNKSRSFLCGTGVYPTKNGKYRVQLRQAGQTHYLGVYATSEAARLVASTFRSEQASFQRETDEFERGNSAYAASFAA